MGKIIAVANQKGGVGKTTTSVNLATCLAMMSKRVLLIDLDPQGSATTSMGINRGLLKHSIYDLFLNKCKFNDAVLTSKFRKGLYVIPATMDLAGVEFNNFDFEKRNYILAELLAPKKDLYDYILIDCSPTLGIMTLNALYAADSVLIPVQCQFLALDGLTQLCNTIKIVQNTKKIHGHDLAVEGILLTMLDKRTKAGWQIVNEVKEYFGNKVFNTFITMNVAAQVAPAHGKPVVLYDPKATSAKLYKSLAKELVAKNA